MKIVLDRLGPSNSERLRQEIPEGAIGGHDAFGPSLSDLLEQLQHIKENFDGSENFERLLPLPHMLADLDIPERGIFGGEMRLTA